MKKLIFLLIAGAYSLSVVAQQTQTVDQQTQTVKRKVRYHHDSLLSNWAIDVNLLGGGLTEKYTTTSTAANYPSGLNLNTGNLKFSNGTSYGFDGELDYFFNRSRHFGVGIGFIYLSQKGTATLDSFHVEYYEATDPKGRVYRQLVTAENPIQEKLNITNLNIPILLKYKDRFSKHFGFMVDAGAMINLQETNAYNTNAAFDYEAIYQYNNEGVAVYDNSPVPSSNDFLITKAHYLANNPNGNVANYFTQQQGLGNNVGLGVKPSSNTGNVSFTSGSLGFIVRPAFNYYFSDMVALTVGGYYMAQPFKNSAQNGYELTNTLGGTGTTANYNSVLHTVTAAPAQSYGVNLGLRIYLSKAKDVDKDGVPDRIDRCPVTFGLEEYDGCPDTDGDGIPDPDDSCPTVKGLAKFHGCPDSDGDGIPDYEDECPYQAGPIEFHGCPDTDGDGIPDKDDSCPTVKGLAQFHGCPDTDGDGVPDNEDQCPTVAGPASNHGCPLPPPPPPPAPVPAVSTQDMSKPILFEVDKTIVHKSAIPTIEEAAKMAKDDPNAAIVIDGYADSRGPSTLNKRLSLERAMAVKAKLKKMGVSPKHIRIRAHGSKAPVASNKTKAGRQKNRRAVMHLKMTHK